MIDAYASQRSYLDHLAPVWHALPIERRGAFRAGTRALVKSAARLGIDAVLGGQRYPGPTLLVAGHHDLLEAYPERPVVYLSHGADQTYREHPSHPAYSGGSGRRRVGLFLVPNERSAGLERAANPDARIEIIGCPRLDPFPPDPERPQGDPLVVAFAWHWDAPIVPESRWAWPQWREPMRDFARRDDFRVIGTGHPRLWGHFAAVYEKWGIEAVEDPTEVLRRADVVCFDNTSLGFEAMAAGLGVVGLNASWYRPDVDHGLRFWDAAPPVMLWPGQAEQLPEAVRLAARLESRKATLAIADRIYPPETRGRSASLAARAIVSFLDQETP